MNHAVEVKNLSVTYDGKVKALDSVSLEIPVSRITGLIGPSGSGKTTLIKSIVGRLKLPADKVVVLDLTAGSAKLRKSVAYMSQEIAIYSDLTVKQNLIYFARVIGYKYSGVRRRVNETLRVIDMYEKRNSLVENLSGGQRQRVSLGVALLGHPKLLVLDEPTVGLDPVLIENLWQLFHELVKDGTTIIISSHSMSEAARCDDLVLMRAGKIIAADSPKKLLQQTKTTDVEQAFLKLVKDEHCAKEDDICYPSKNILTCHPELDSGSNNKEATNNNNTLSNWIPDQVRNDGINFTKSFTTASRVLRQLIHDPRTLMLIFAVPPLLLWLLKYVFDGQLQVFNQFAPASWESSRWS